MSSLFLWLFAFPSLVSGQSCGSAQEPVRSPDSSRVAFAACVSNGSHAASTELVIANEAGKELYRSPALNRAKLGGECEVERVEWVDSNRVGVLCKYDPLLKDYVLLNLQSGTMEQEQTGYWFQWSPDGKALASVGLLLSVGTPAGQNSCLYFNGESAYPSGCHYEQELVRHKSDTGHALTGIHTFFFPLQWSPDSRRVAFVEKIFDFTYTDPYSRYLDGYSRNVRYFVVIAAPGKPAVGYPLDASAEQSQIEWEGDQRLRVGGTVFDLTERPPVPVP